VVFEDDNDKAAKKARENEAMKKRQQNAVPSWHAWSTVSGEMTALGAEAAKRLDLPMDDTKAEGEAEVEERDSAREEYYKQYYENLALDQQQQEGEETFDTVDENGTYKRDLDDAEDSARFVIVVFYLELLVKLSQGLLKSDY
jgi:transcription initiation factor TFIIE subunit alpha